MAKFKFISMTILMLIIIFGGGILGAYYTLPTYSISYNSNGGSITLTTYVKAQQKAEKPNDPIKNGYTFAGWYYNQDKYNFDERVTNNLTLEAKWIEQKEFVTLTFDYLNNLEIENIELEVGTKLSTVPTTNKENYRFLGWYYQNKEFDFSQNIEKNMTFIANWEKIE